MRLRAPIPMLAALLLPVLLLPGLAAAVTFDLETATGTVGDVVELPIALTGLGGDDIRAFELDIHWSATYAECTGVITTGTLTDGWVVSRLIEPGHLVVTAAAASPLAGDGTLLRLQFLLGPTAGNGYVYLDEAVCNEGNPVPVLDNGILYISALPTINVSPNNGLMYVGSTLEFSTSGGTPPYVYTSSDPAVAEFYGDDVLVAEAPGQVQVTSTDDIGTHDTTDGFIEVRPFRLMVMPAAGLEGDVVNVQILIVDPAGYDIVSSEVTFTWSASYAEFAGLITAASLPEAAGWSPPLVNSSPGRVTLVTAGSTPLPGPGLMFTLQFVPGPYSFAVTVESSLFNETHQAYPVNGTVTVTALPNLSVTPGTLELLVDDTYTFNAGGGPTPPLTWSTSDPAIAEIDAAGELTALAEGVVIVHVEDILGATADSGPVRVCSLGLPAIVSSIDANEVVTVDVTSDRWLNDLEVYSAELAVSYNPSAVIFLGAGTAGALMAPWGMPLVTDEGGLLRIYNAGAYPLESCGPALVKLTFIGRPDLSYTYTGITLTDALFNEGVPCALINRGSPCTGGTPASPPPVRMELWPARPNPFNPNTTISFALETAGRVRLAVYDSRGKLIRRLVDEHRAAGVTHEERWDGRDDGGRLAASGVYYARLSGAGKDLTRKMVLLK